MPAFSSYSLAIRAGNPGAETGKKPESKVILHLSSDIKNQYICAVMSQRLGTN